MYCVLVHLTLMAFRIFVMVLSVVLSNKVGIDGEAGEKDVLEVDAS